MNKKAITLFLLILLQVFTVVGLTEQLTVSSCNAAGCSATGWNDRDNTNDGSSLTPGTTDALTMNDPSFDNRSIINNIIVGHNHGGSNPNIDGNVTYTFRNSAATITYCVSTTPNINNYRYDIVSPTGCSWDYAKLIDLVIVIRHNGTQRTLYNDFINFTINYTAYNDTTPPNISLGQPDNDSWKTVSTFDFFFIPNDENNLTNCSLMINNTRNSTKYGSENLTRGVQNNISSTLADGVYLWTINCTDSWNNTGTNSSQKTIKVDTAPPVVNLEYPANNTPWPNQSVLFKFNSTDLMTMLSICELIIDGQVKDSKVSPAESVSLNFSYSPGNGLHNWSVNCTDSNGLKGYSNTYNLSVDYVGPTMLTGAGSYEQGQTAMIYGSNWNNGVQLNINLTLSNGTKKNWNLITNSSGGFSTSYFINYSDPLGQYNVSAYEELTPTNNASNSFNVIKRPVNAYTDYTNYKQGDQVFINVTGLSPNSSARLIINWSGGSYSVNVSANTVGYLNFTYNLSYIATLGVYNVSVLDLNFSNLNASTNFSVEQRVAVISTDKSSYNVYELVNVTGLFFTRFGTVNLTIFENSSGAVAPLFPKQIISDGSGGFNYGWNVTDTCPGVYGIRAVDVNNSFLNNTVYITILAASINYDYNPSSSYEWDGGANNVATLYTMNDASEETLTVSGTNNYLGINFSYSLNPSSTISYIRFWYKHYVSDTKIAFSQLEWLNGSVWQVVSGCAITSPTTSTLEYCDLNNYVKNGSQANDLRLRAAYTKSSGSSYPAIIDYAHINLTATGSATCSDWDNQPPVITSLGIDDSQTTPSNQIDLTAGYVRNVSCNVTVYDYDGYSSISLANATLYYYTNASTSPDSNSSHYTNKNCSETGFDVNNKYFSCDFLVWYWAKNGTWYCNVTTVSGLDITSKIANTTINPLYALNASSTIIDYGTMQPMEVSAGDVVEAVFNLGNMPIDLGLEAYARIPSDNLSMNCSANGNISLDAQRYSLTAAQAWTSMTPVTAATTYLAAFDLSARNDSVPINRSVYWKLRPDPLSLGDCNGTVVFTATAG